MAYTTIKKPSDYFNTKLYTGNGVGGTNITGVGFQPDLVWIKRRSGVENHVWNDAVRGVPNNIYSSSTNAEDSGSLMSAILSDGFTVQTDPSVNSNTDTYVAWNWLGANGTASNTDGSITSTVSANTTSGFSIVSYTGTGANATIGHGLAVAPKMVIAKKRSGTGAWGVYHEGIGNPANAVSLENASGARSEPAYWNSTSPTSSVFSVGTSGDTNSSGGTYIAYCFAEVKGFSKFGSYVGNGSTDGTFIYTGFKPAFFICKRTSDIDDWFVFDNKRQGYNVSNNELRPNTTAVEGTTDRIDILSNGIKHRQGGSAQNRSGDTYMYMAFAEEPLVGDNPATAR